MAISVVKFMEERGLVGSSHRNAHGPVTNLSDDSVQMIRAALKKYSQIAVDQYHDLVDVQKETGSKDTALMESIQSLSSLIKTMKSIDSKGATTNSLNEFFKKYEAVFRSLDTRKGAQDGSYSEMSRRIARDEEARSKELKDLGDELSTKLGENFESVISQHASQIGSVQGSALKVALSSLLGPAAPLVAVVDKLFDVDESMAKATTKTFGLIGSGLGKIRSLLSDKKDAEDDDQEDRRSRERHQRKKDGWFESILNLLGIVAHSSEEQTKAHKQGLFGSLGSAILRAIKKPFAMLEKIPGFHAAKKLLGALGIAGGKKALGVVGGVLSKAPLVGRLFTKGGGAAATALEGGEAAATVETGAAAEGAALGAGALPVLAGVAAVAAAGYGVYELYKHRKEVKEFLEKTGAIKAATKVLHGLSAIAVSIVGGINQIGKAIAASTIGKALSDLGVAFGHLGERVLSILSGLGGTAADELGKFFGGTNRVLDFLGQVWGMLSNSALLKTVGSLGLAGIQSLFSGIGSIVEWVASFVDALAAGNVKQFMGKQWQQIQDGVVSGLQAVQRVFKWIATNVGPVLVSPIVHVLGGLKMTIGSVLSSVANMLTTGWVGRIVSHIPGVGKALASLSNEGSALTQSGSRMIAQNDQDMSRVVSSVTPYVASGASRVVGAMASALGYSSQQSQALAASTSGAVYQAARYAGKLLIPNPTVRQVIVDAARQVGVDPGLMLAIASAESGFNPNAKATTSSATGLYQFTAGTWSSMVTKYGSQYGIRSGDAQDPRANAIMGALFVRDNANALAKAGVAPDVQNIYMAHFMGAGGAIQFVHAMNRNPGASAASIFPAQAAANKSIFYAGDGAPRSLAQVYQLMTDNPAKVTVAKVASYDRMIGSTQSTPVLATASTPTFSRVSPTQQQELASSATAATTPVATPSERKAAAATTSPVVASSSLSVDSVPSFITDEGLLILNLPGVAA